MRWLSPPESVPEFAREHQIIEADIDEEGEPLADLLQDAHRDLVLLVVQRLRQRLEPAGRLADREFRDLGDVLAGDLDRERFRLQPRPAAGLARRRALIALDLLARPARLRLAQRRSRLVTTPSKLFFVR